MIEAGELVLFQGDSITDCGRDREVAVGNESYGLGRGYAQMATGGSAWR